MTVQVTDTPRYLTRLAGGAPVLFRVLSGSVRLAQRREDLTSGAGLPLAPSDGPQNWIMPDGDIWVVADGAGGATLEVWLP
jgi:hypothetical protein